MLIKVTQRGAVLRQTLEAPTTWDRRIVLILLVMKYLVLCLSSVHEIKFNLIFLIAAPEAVTTMGVIK